IVDNRIIVENRYKKEIFILKDNVDKEYVAEKLTKIWQEYYKKVFDNYEVYIHIDKDENEIKIEVSIYIKYGDKLIFADSNRFRIKYYGSFYVNKEVLAELLKEFKIIAFPEKLDL
ncbi:MAG: hypothetical protein ACP5G1_04955, partial [Nanopusillaceae archaeon]